MTLVSLLFIPFFITAAVASEILADRTRRHTDPVSRRRVVMACVGVISGTLVGLAFTGVALYRLTQGELLLTVLHCGAAVAWLGFCLVKLRTLRELVKAPSAPAPGTSSAE